MRTAITGATGFVGKALVERFAIEGHETIQGTRQRDEMTQAQSHPLNYLDFRDPSRLGTFCSGVKSLVHLSGPDANACEASSTVVSTYVEDTLALYDAASASGVENFVYVSTVHVYGMSETQKFDESSECRPISAYGKSRIMAENMLSEVASKSATKLAIVRLSNTFGWNDDPRGASWRLFTNEIVLSGLESRGITVRGNPESSRDFVSVDVATRAIEKLVLNAELERQPQIWNVGSGESMTLAQMAQHVADSIEKIAGFRPSISLEGSLSAVKSSLKINIARAIQSGILMPSEIEVGLDSLVEKTLESLSRVVK